MTDISRCRLIGRVLSSSGAIKLGSLERESLGKHCESWFSFGQKNCETAICRNEPVQIILKAASLTSISTRDA